MLQLSLGSPRRNVLAGLNTETRTDAGEGPMPTSKPQLAFIAAALVLLVMPLLVMMGLSALGFATQIGMVSQADRVASGEAGGLLLTVFVLWAVLVLVAVLGLIAWLVRYYSNRIDNL
jgi:hypothetical protein